MAELLAYVYSNLLLVVGGLYVLKVLVDAGLLLMIVKFVSDFTSRSPVAQSVERSAVNRQVVGSSPTRGATKEVKPDKTAKPVVESFSDEYKLPANPFE
jgi:hypothetical protein